MLEAGAWYHVVNRGNNRQQIFMDAGDYEHFLDVLAKGCESFKVELHAYVLMGNHYHLLIRTPNANASAAIQWPSGDRRIAEYCGSLKNVSIEGGSAAIAAGANKTRPQSTNPETDIAPNTTPPLGQKRIRTGRAQIRVVLSEIAPHQPPCFTDSRAFFCTSCTSSISP